jgi:hypothetical protein
MVVRFGRLIAFVSGIGCSLCLVLGCASEPSPGLAAPTSPDSGAVESDRATATPTGVTPGSAGSPQPVSTPVMDVSGPLPTPARDKVENMPTAEVSPGVQDLVDLAVADLAERLTIEVDRIEVVEVRSMVWPDGSLGCPEPDVAYTQVQREGLLIRLRAGQRVYRYHSGTGRPPFLCEHPDFAAEDLPPSPGLRID